MGIDRRHAGLLFNAIAYFFQTGWQFDISAVHTPVNAFYRTRDDRLIFFNGDYAHLRDGILRFLDCPSDASAIARRVARHDAQPLEDELAAAGLSTVHSAGRSAPALIPAYFNDYGTGCLGALGVLVALQRRALEGGAWNGRVSLARTAMLGLRFAQNHEAIVPIGEQDLNHYLVDQDSPLGLLTRVAPGMRMSQTPPFVERSGSFPGAATLEVGWGPDASERRAPPHRPTSIFSLGLAHWRGSQVL